MRYLGSVALGATCALALTAGAKPPQQAESAADSASQVKMKIQQAFDEKAMGLVAGEANSGLALRGPCPNSVVRTPGLAIVDNSTVFDTVATVGDPLLNVKVELNILHTWQGDLIVRLRHEVSGTEVTLINRPGNPQTTFGFSADNYGDNGAGIPFVLDDTAATTYDVPAVAAPGILNVTGTWRADDPASQTLAAFNGLTGNTTWTLSVSDNAGGDVGTVVRWAICSDNALQTSSLSGIGSATPSSVVSGDDTVISVQVTPGNSPPSTGIMVVADLSALGGSSSQSLADQGGNLYSYTQTVTAAFGSYTIPFTITDAQARSYTGSIPVQVIPVNDNCPGIVVTAPANIFGSTTGATPSGNTLCGVNSRDVFYQFTPTVSGSYTIDTCGTTWDTRLSVYTDCPATAQIACNDDACGLQSRVTLDLAAATTYYIRVSAFSITGGGDFVLNISAPPVPTGACCIAGVCSVQTEANCLGNGGSYLGDNSNCGDGVGPTYEYTSTPGLGIPDNQCTTVGFVSDSLNVSDSFVVGDVNVRVQITHTFLGDLRIRLTKDSTVVAVWERQCGGNDNMDVTFDDEGTTVVCATPTIGTYRPAGTGAGPLSLFDGINSSGTWTLQVCDAAGVDVGTVNSWTLILREQDGSICGAPCPADWDGNNQVEVADIFAFLGDWFAGIPAATNFGGTPGVPAIFAYLAEWFAHGIGPC